MHNEEILYIEDNKKRKLLYRFTPASVVSNFVPLVVILDNEVKIFEYKMWNVLIPIVDAKDAEEDFCNRDLLQELIAQVAEEHECEEHIYLYGNFTGAYEAILHGLSCNANAVYACEPKIANEQVLIDLLNAKEHFPLLYLCKERDDLDNEMVNFKEACEKHAIELHLDFFSESEYDEISRIKKVLDMFEKVTS